MRRLAAPLVAFALAGCASNPKQEVSPTRPPARVYAAATVHWARTSAEYRALALQTYRLARERVLAAASGRVPRTWAVVLDVDETVLDTSLYAKERMAVGAGFDDASWAEHVRRRVDAAIPGARDFLDAVRAAGGVIAFVTNRREPICEDTRRNLESERLAFDVVLCRAEDASGDKAPRFQQVERGDFAPALGPLEVLAYVGDNILDFPGGAQSLRDAPDESLAAFGTRYFVIPNPVYGSWERNPPR